MDERSIKGELEGYLRERDMNEYFTSIIESCLMSQPENPSMHIMRHLMKAFPAQVPTTVGAALDAYFRVEAAKAKDEAKQMAEGGGHKGGGGGGGGGGGTSTAPGGSSVVSQSSGGSLGGQSSLAPSQQGGGGALSGVAEEDDDEALLGEKHCIDGLVAKFMAVASEAGVLVRLGGWPGHPALLPAPPGPGPGAAGGIDIAEDGGVVGGMGRLATDDADIHGGDAATRGEEAVTRLREIAQVLRSRRSYQDAPPPKFLKTRPRVVHE
jgi:hypothetical protein